LTFLARLVLILAGAASIAFGVHGLVVYFSPLEVLFKDPQQLFLEVEVPEAFRGAIEWMSLKGFQSWAIPAVFVGLGVVIWAASSQISNKRTT